MVYFMVDGFFVPGDWTYKLHSANITAVTLRLERINVIVINIYNLIGNQEVIIISRLIKIILHKIEGKVILLKDFNAHHPVWGGRAAAYKPQLKYLLAVIKRRALHLLTL